MRSIVLLFAGLIVAGAGILVYFAGVPLAAVILTPVGSLLIVMGLIGYFRGSARSKLNAQIMQTGIATDGTVTFADKNYSFLINNKPVYTIVEYTYQDASGTKHVRRVDNIPSDWAIRNKIEVGGIVKVKYMQQNPSQSVMVVG